MAVKFERGYNIKNESGTVINQSPKAQVRQRDDAPVDGGTPAATRVLRTLAVSCFCAAIVLFVTGTIKLAAIVGAISLMVSILK